MKQSFETAQKYGGESVETAGAELEKAYAELFGCRVDGGLQDGGVDLICDGIPGVSLVQVKSSVSEVKRFLAKSLERKEFIPIVVGDFGQYSRDEILDSIRKNGGWVGPDVPDREKTIEGINRIPTTSSQAKRTCDGMVSWSLIFPCKKMRSFTTSS